MASLDAGLLLSASGLALLAMGLRLGYRRHAALVERYASLQRLASRVDPAADSDGKKRAAAGNLITPSAAQVASVGAAGVREAEAQEKLAAPAGCDEIEYSSDAEGMHAEPKRKELRSVLGGYLDWERERRVREQMPRKGRLLGNRLVADRVAGAENHILSTRSLDAFPDAPRSPDARCAPRSSDAPRSPDASSLPAASMSSSSDPRSPVLDTLSAPPLSGPIEPLSFKPLSKRLQLDPMPHLRSGFSDPPSSLERQYDEGMQLIEELAGAYVYTAHETVERD
jgi:hypothetical protein